MHANKASPADEVARMMPARTRALVHGSTWARRPPHRADWRTPENAVICPNFWTLTSEFSSSRSENAVGACLAMRGNSPIDARSPHDGSRPGPARGGHSIQDVACKAGLGAPACWTAECTNILHSYARVLVIRARETGDGGNRREARTFCSCTLGNRGARSPAAALGWHESSHRWPEGHVVVRRHTAALSDRHIAHDAD